jgi:aspartate/methionine/tyrosine aminotransferase
MWERTISISSCGKTFSMTGWKVGWCFGHRSGFFVLYLSSLYHRLLFIRITFGCFSDLIRPIMLANQWIQYCVSTPTCRALSYILEQADKPYEGFPSYYAYLCADYQK